MISEDFFARAIRTRVNVGARGRRACVDLEAFLFLPALAAFLLSGELFDFSSSHTMCEVLFRTWMILFALVASVKALLVFASDAARSREDIAAKDEHLAAGLRSRKDPVLAFLLLLTAALAASCCASSAVQWMHSRRIFLTVRISVIRCVLFFLVCDLMRVCALKWMIARRLRSLRSVEPPATLATVIGVTRHLVGCNAALNRRFQLPASAIEAAILSHALVFVYSVWLDYVGKAPPSMRDQWPHVAPNSLCYAIAILVHVFSSCVQNEVDSIKELTDMMKYTMELSEQERKMSFLFILELEHSKVLLSCYGLFDFSCFTITTMIGSMIAYQLVLIQFS